MYNIQVFLPVQKAKTVYEYLINLASYEVSEHDQSIAGIFWKKSAVCAGYAGAAQYLLERLNVPCIYVEGEAVDSEQSHAWNIVEIDGQNYYMDVTSGVGSPGVGVGLTSGVGSPGVGVGLTSGVGSPGVGVGSSGEGVGLISGAGSSGAGVDSGTSVSGVSSCGVSEG